MTNAVTVREESRALTPAQQRTEQIRSALVSRLPAILPAGLSAERFEAVTIQAIAKNPQLMEADPSSVVMAVLEAAQLGLEPTGSLSRAWLVTYRSKESPRPLAQLMIGYQGLVDLARRSGEVEKVWARVVYNGDEFTVEYGSTERIIHHPRLGATDPASITHVYAIALLKGGQQMFEVMTRDEVERVRARSRAANSGPWVTDTGEMYKKTVVRRLAKSLPLTAEAREAIARDDEREFAPRPEPEQRPDPAVSVRERLAKRRQALQDAPQAVEAVEVAPEAAPAESAPQRSSEAPVADAPKRQRPQRCGAQSDPALGEVVACVLTAGHAFADGKPSAHQAEDGTKFPQRKEAAS